MRLVFILSFSLFGYLFIQPISLYSQSVDTSHLAINPQTGDLNLTVKGAAHFAQLALNCIQQEYPNKLSHVMGDSTEVLPPSILHPAFYGCFDWHSSVHGHWMLIRLLKLYPEMEEADEIIRKLNTNLSPGKIQMEVAYFNQKNRKSFERTYGWAWLLKLAEELHSWDHPMASKWEKHLQPLTDVIVARYLNFLPRQQYPIRTGVHPNTAFGLSFAWDYAKTVNHKELKALVELTSIRYYGFDVSCPAEWEPGGEDFLSPCLEEANLMRRVLSPPSFRDWFGRFMPTLPLSLRDPANVSDRTDGKIVHLDGLNLSRGWSMLGIASALDASDPRNDLFIETANRHILATLPNIASGDYAGEHWLASFAVYVLSVE